MLNDFLYVGITDFVEEQFRLNKRDITLKDIVECEKVRKGNE